MNTKRKGFTLIELLVVIAIIALLLSILMPSLGKARENARSTVCKANLKQWGMITILYANDYGDSFWTGNNDTLPLEQWKKALWSQALRHYYNKVDGVRLCPSAARPICKTQQDFIATRRYMGDTKHGWGVYDDSCAWTEAGDYGSYGTNGYCENPGRGMWTSEKGYSWNTVLVRPANNIPVFMDMTWLEAWVFHDVHTPPKKPDDPAEFFNEMSRVTMARHSGAINAQFLDGSVRKVGLKADLWSLKYSRLWDTNNAKTKSSYKWPAWLKKY